MRKLANTVEIDGDDEVRVSGVLEEWEGELASENCMDKGMCKSQTVKSPDHQKCMHVERISVLGR